MALYFALKTMVLLTRALRCRRPTCCALAAPPQSRHSSIHFHEAPPALGRPLQPALRFLTLPGTPALQHRASLLFPTTQSSGRLERTPLPLFAWTRNRQSQREARIYRKASCKGFWTKFASARPLRKFLILAPLPFQGPP